MENIDALARRVEERCDEIKQRFSEVFGILPEEIRRDMAEWLNKTVLRPQNSITYSSPDEAQKQAERVSKNCNEVVLIPRNVFRGANYLMHGFIIWDGSANYTIGWAEYTDSIRIMLQRQLTAPESVVEDIVKILDKWHALFIERVRRWLNDNPMLDEMFTRMVGLKRSHEEVVAEMASLRENLAKSYGIITAGHEKNRVLCKQIRETARALRDTKGFVRSKTLMGIRENLENVLHEDEREISGGQPGPPNPIPEPKPWPGKVIPA